MLVTSFMKKLLINKIFIYLYNIMNNLKIFTKMYSIENGKVKEDVDEQLVYKNGEGKYKQYKFGKLTEEKKILKIELDKYLEQIYPNSFIPKDIFEKAYNILNLQEDYNKKDAVSLEDVSLEEKDAVSLEDVSLEEKDAVPLEPYIKNKDTIEFTKNIIKREYKKSKNSKKCKEIKQKYNIKNQYDLKELYQQYFKKLNPTNCKHPECKRQWLEFISDYDFYNDVNNVCFD